MRGLQNARRNQGKADYRRLTGRSAAIPIEEPIEEPVSRRYVGRFAPSPSGLLHFGSILTAIASFLDARSQGGQWLVRIEDIDPPREQPGAAAAILRQLEAHGLNWDDAVLYQSQRTQAYEAAHNTLADRGLCYGCDCGRARIRGLKSGYDRKCLNRKLLGNPGADTGIATRLLVNTRSPRGFIDLFRGPQNVAIEPESGDFILRRRDQRWSYQFAVCIDDVFQGITHVIRGGDLLTSTPGQIYLHRTLGHTPPQYGHVPVVVDSQGKKLSKQNYAAILKPQSTNLTVYNALVALEQKPPPILRRARSAELLAWAVANWQRHNLAAAGHTITEQATAD